MTKQRHAFDYYETPRWAIWCLLESGWRPKGRIFCPTVGAGAIMNAVKFYANRYELGRLDFVTNDIDPNHPADFHLDMTLPESWETIANEALFDCVIENLPFGVAPKIMANMFEHSAHNAMFLRNTWIEPCDNRKYLKDHEEDHIIALPRYSFDDEGSDKTACTWYIYDKSFVAQKPLTRFYKDQIEDYFRKPSQDPLLQLEERYSEFSPCFVLG